MGAGADWKSRLFADDTTVAPASSGAPTPAEIATFAAAQSPAYEHGLVFYTGTDTATDAITHVFIIDRDGVATSVAPKLVASAVTAVRKYAADFVIADFTSEAITWAAATHGMGTDPVVAIYAGAGATKTFEDDPTVIASVTYNAAGDVTLTVQTGQEFDGRVIIS